MAWFAGPPSPPKPPPLGLPVQGRTPAQALCEAVGLDGLPGVGEEQAPDTLAA